MGKVISFVHISLDGYVAGPNGEMNWIRIDQELFDHIGKRISETDSAIYGRVTYEMMESYWPTAADKPNASKHDVEHSKWYKTARKIVLSNTMKPEGLVNTEVISEDLVSKINSIKKETVKDILVFGSPTATHSLIRENLIDGYWLFVNPIVLGKGIPLFVEDQAKMDLRLTSTKQFSSGVVELSYIN